MNENGEWIRPIVSNGPARFWAREKLIQEGKFIRCGDIWEIKGYSPSVFQHPNHTEDFVADKFKYRKSLSNEEFIEFLREKVLKFIFVLDLQPLPVTMELNTPK